MPFRERSGNISTMVRRLPIILGVLAVLPFITALGAGYVWDDHLQIATNAHLNLFDLPGYWLQSEHRYADIGRPSRYNPLGWSLFLLESMVSGGSRPAWLYHLTSLLFHGLAAGLLTALLSRLMRRAGHDDIPMPVTAAVLWFAWSPIQSEVVCWPSARFDSLALVLLLAAGLWSLRSRRPATHLMCGLLASACLLSKEGALPLVILVTLGLPWVADRGATRNPRAHEWRMGTVGALFGITMVLIGRHLVGVSAPAGIGEVPPIRILSCTSALARLAFFQSELSLLRPVIVQPSLGDLITLSVVVGIGIVGLLGRRQLQGRLAALGAIWFVAGLAPNAIAAARYELLPDRYIYLAMPGVSMMIAAAVMAVQQRFGRGAIRWGGLGLAALGLMFVLRDIGQMRRWTSDLECFTWERAQWPDAPQAAYFLGQALTRNGRLKEAELELIQATKLGIFLPQAWKHLALVRDAMGAHEAAIQTVRQGLTYLPDEPDLLALLKSLESPESAPHE